eukprot:11270-Heterococcus_DN1.PRE.3
MHFYFAGALLLDRLILARQQLKVAALVRCTHYRGTADHISHKLPHCCTLSLPQQPKALVQKGSGSGSGSGRAQSGGNRNNNSSNGNNQDSARRSTGGRGGGG